MRVALFVGALNVDDCDVRTQSAYGDKFFIAYRGLKFAEVGVFFL